VQFIVKADGSVSDVEALNDPGYGFAKDVVAMMKDSPKWNPALKNGKPVNSHHMQPVTFVIQQQ
jgi:protein TonB